MVHPDRPLQVKDMLALKQKFMTIVTRFQIKSLTTEDVLYDFYLKMLRPSEKDGLNYLERYDGSTALTTWFYKPLKNMCFSIKQREKSVGGQSINNAASIEEAPEKETEFDGSVLYLENFNAGQPSLEAVCMANQLLEIARIRYSDHRSTSSKGYPRSPFFVVKCLNNGLSKAQIAKVLECSTTFVESLLKKFLADAEVISIKQEYYSTK